MVSSNISEGLQGTLTLAPKRQYLVLQRQYDAEFKHADRTGHSICCEAERVRAISLILP